MAYWVKILAEINPTATESMRLCLRKAHDNVHESLACDWLATGSTACEMKKRRRDQNKLIITKGNNKI